MAVVDASVFVAYFHVAEAGHADARAWIRAAALAGRPLSAPSILLPEVVGAVGRRQGRTEDAEAALTTLGALPGLTLAPVTPDLAERAALLAAQVRVRGCDAIYVALAESLGVPLVTLDREQLERGGTIVTARTPADQRALEER